MTVQDGSQVTQGEPVPDRLVVHGGVFHADDTMTAALLRRLNPGLEIERVRDATGREGEQGTLVADIGGGRFDHHQPDAALRADGHKHAAVGLVYEAFPQLRPENDMAAKWLERTIADVEDWDNGAELTRGDMGFGSRTAISRLVANSNPSWDSDVHVDKAFEDVVRELGDNVVDVVTGIDRDAPVDEAQVVLDDVSAWAIDMAFGREAERERSAERARGIVQDAVEASDGKVVALDRFVPWQDVVCETDASFVTFPSMRGGYNLQCVPTEPGSRDQRQPLPRAWLDERPDGCSFVHQGRFMAVFDTKEHAVEAGRSVVDQRSQRRMPGVDVTGASAQQERRGPAY